MSGSSPQARGTHARADILDVWPRFIPAGAGNADGHQRIERDGSVHPRRRGERRPPWTLVRRTVGSSPQARGTPHPVARSRESERFIPAGAGNANGNGLNLTTTPVHPRRRGERSSPCHRRDKATGSSPQARGTPCEAPAYPQRSRFIPAGAGNAPAPRAVAPPGPVHPRRRGERTMADAAVGAQFGSSPQARGTLFR